MAVATRYWRVSFRCSVLLTDTCLSISRIYLTDDQYVDLSIANPVQAITVNSGTIIDTTMSTDPIPVPLYPAENLLDGDDATYTVILWANSTNTAAWSGFTFDLGVGVALLPDHITILLSNTPVLLGVMQPPSQLSIRVESSDDNITWVENSSVPAGYLTNSYTWQHIAVAPTSRYHFIPDPGLIGGTGGIYGIVSEDGVALPNRPVYLYDRNAMARIGYTTTDVNGGYVFNGLNTQNQYLVMSVDPSGPPYKNAIVWDRISPINTKGADIVSDNYLSLRSHIPDFAGYVGFWGVAASALATNHHFQRAPLSTGTLQKSTSTQYLGYNFAADLSGAGNVRYITSDAVADPNATVAGHGLHGTFTAGVKNGINESGQVANYEKFAFETSFIAPQITEPNLRIGFGGTADDNDAKTPQNNAASGFNEVARALELQVNYNAIYLRLNLGALNMGTTRISYSVIPGTKYHVLVNFEQDVLLEMFINGVSVGTQDITGAGRIWSYTQALPHASMDNFVNYGTTYYSHSTYMRRFFSFYVMGGGAVTSLMTGNGFGGAFGHAALFLNTMTAQNVADLYNSWLDPNTITVLPVHTGYMAQVEQDTPLIYLRLNEQTAVAAGPRPIPGVGLQTIGTDFVGALGYATAAPLIYGDPSITFTAADAYVRIRHFTIPPTFSIECFCRPTSTGSNFIIGSVEAQLYYRPVTVFIFATDIHVRVCAADNLYTTFVIAPGSIVTNAVNHVVVSYDAWDLKQITAVVNGVVYASQNTTIIPRSVYEGLQQDYFGDGLTWSSNTLIGADPTEGHLAAPTFTGTFNGELGEVAVYGYYLSAERAIAHYDSRLA